MACFPFKSVFLDEIPKSDLCSGGWQFFLASMEQQDQWPADLDAPIVVYCGSGHRSTIAGAILWSYGYTNVHCFKDGFGGWMDAGIATAEFSQ